MLSIFLILSLSKDEENRASSHFCKGPPPGEASPNEYPLTIR